jgi:hypothetical protein
MYCSGRKLLVYFPTRLLQRIHSDDIVYQLKLTQCPKKQPMCDIGPPGYSYCTYAPDKTCYANGWPPCCSQNGGVNCPKIRPDCTIESLTPPGASYCTYAPDTTCYRSGWPACCNESNNLHVGEILGRDGFNGVSSSTCPNRMLGIFFPSHDIQKLNIVSNFTTNV